MKKDTKEKRKKGVKTSAREQRKKAAQGARDHVHKSPWVGLIQEYHDDTSVGRKVFKEVHPKMKNHQQTISMWTKILVADAKKRAQTS